MNDEQRRHVLVVDDEPDFVAFLQFVLTKGGYRVTVAYDGEEALERALADPPDAVTLDIQMPRKTGVLFYRQMKAQEHLRHIPVIVVTGLRTSNAYAAPFIERFFEVDTPPLPRPECYLDKPVTGARLLETVAQYVLSPAAAPPRIPEAL
jgi:CheY-like chemotaxis protein